MIETAILRKLGFRVKRKLKTLQAFIPEPRIDDLGWKQQITPGAAREALTHLDRMPLITALAIDRRLHASLSSQFPAETTLIQKLARRAVNHQFDLLGSGLKHLGEEIDWCIDFKSGKRWPLKDYRLQKIVDLQDNSDVKVPWELSRCNHFVTIAVAFTLTHDTQLALEFENQIISWREQNPYQQTVNWTCAMETAIRCVNWLIAYQIFATHFHFAQTFKDILTIELFKGGKYIRENLEKTATGFNTNHYLSDLLGLLYLGQLFENTDSGSEWLAFAQCELEKEMLAQVAIDGLDYESSLPYHGLVTEIFALCRLLGDQCGFEFSNSFNERLKLMLVNLARFTGGDGRVVAFGDADDGRVLTFAGRHPRDFRDLLALGQQLYHRLRLDRKYETVESQVLAGKSTGQADHQPLKSVCLTQSGICQLRSNSLVANFFVNKVGAGGLGNHKHNDLLSLTLEYNGMPLLVDPGSFVYTEDEKWRNHFRSTESHSTVLIDWEEQNRMVNGLLFFLRTDGTPQTSLWESSESADTVTASHDCYRRLSGGVVHERTLYLDKESELLLIRDRLLGSEKHDIQCLFQFANLRIESLNQWQVVFHPAKDEAGVLFIDLSDDPQLFVDTNLISPSYGVKEPGIRICSGGKYDLPVSKTFAIVPLAGRSADEATSLARQRIQDLRW